MSNENEGLIAAPAGVSMRTKYSQSWAVAHPGGNLIAGIFSDQRGGDEAAKRYAVLFAASPDLLEALTELLPIVKEYLATRIDDPSLPGSKSSKYAWSYERGQFAISKATGGAE